MASQGVHLPISLQIENLTEIANQLKSFASSNILSDSLGSKKINQELSKVLHTLGSIEAKSKSAFKTEGDFTSLDKDVKKIELSLDHVKQVIAGLSFEDLKIPAGSQKQIDDLTSRMNELRAGLTAFKSLQKEKLMGNGGFLVDFEKAFPKKSSQMLAQDYDSIYQAVKEGMARINAEMLRANTELQNNREAVEKNLSGKNSATAVGALDWLQNAFKAFPKSGKMNQIQEMLSKYMNIGTLEDGISQGFTGFKKGGYTGLMSLIQKQFELDPSQMAAIEDKVRKATQEASKRAKTTAFATLREMGNNQEYGSRVLTGNNYATTKKSSDEYNAQVGNASAAQSNVNAINSQMQSMNAVWQTLQQTQGEVIAKQNEVSAALRGPEDSLNSLKVAILALVQANPQLAASFGAAISEIERLRGVAAAGQVQLTRLDSAVSKLQGISNFVNRYIGAYAVMRRTITAIKNAINNIRDLDKTITNIAVVTNMTQQDLWGKIGEYTAVAQQYGVATKEVYAVSQIFYQQGLDTAQVMSLTTETLKMAKISGMEYSEAANAMTVAIRAFKIEMTDAQQVTDTYSALAAKFAVSSEEIANAMEKTASSAANVGMSLQSTSAFISVMEQTTREGAQNIGSALKSIISRYGEMKASPDKLLNIDGEDVSFNKVDTALKSIGISIKDATGQFRDFDDVIMELASKWDTLDNNTQRYIATVMAGNRQQSRFIALVSNYDELSRAMKTAENSQNASIIQVGKTMDSLETKINQVKNAWQQMYLSLHVEDGLKNVLGFVTRILKTIGRLGTWKGLIPSIVNVLGFGSGIKNVVKGAQNILNKRMADIKRRVELNTDDAKAKNKELETEVGREIQKTLKLVPDTTQLTNAQITNGGMVATPTGVVNPASTQLTNMYGLASQLAPGLTQQQFMQGMTKGFENGMLNDPKKREELLSGMGVTGKHTTEYQQLNGLMDSFSGLTGAAEALKGGLQSAADAAGRQADAANQGVNVEGRRQNAVEQSIQTEERRMISTGEVQQGMQGAVQGAQNAGNAMSGLAPTVERVNQAMNPIPVQAGKVVTGANGVVHAQQGEEMQTRNVTSAKRSESLISRLLSHSKKGEATASDQSADADKREAAASEQAANANAQQASKIMSAASIFSTLFRIAGMALLTYGAQMTDKSTDSVEQSKITTGIGNGLSGAGTGLATGAAIGTMIYPGIGTAIGAVLGGVGGFLLGGLPAIIDGFNYTYAEKYEHAKEEFEESNNASLEAQAKTQGLAGALSEYKMLQKTMYDSTESMQQFQSAASTLAESYSELVVGFDSAGNAIIDLSRAEQLLAATRAEAAASAKTAAESEINATHLRIKALEEKGTLTSAEEQELKIAKQTLSNLLLKYESTYGEYVWQTAVSGSGLDNETLALLSANPAFGRMAMRHSINTSQRALRGTNADASSYYSSDSAMATVVYNYGSGTKKWKTPYTDTEGTGLDLHTWSNVSGLITFLDSLDTSVLENVIDKVSDLSGYSSADSLLQELNLDESLPNYLDFKNAIEAEIQYELDQTRDKIYDRLFEDGNPKKGIKQGLTGLHNIEGGTELTHKIVDAFDGIERIAPKYADFFIEQILAVNRLANQGYETLARYRLTALEDMAATLENMNDTDANKLFPILTKIDFSDYKSLQTARDSVVEYARENGLEDDVNINNILETLDDAMRSIMFNVTSLANTLSTDCSNAAKKIDKIISANKSGMDLSTALDAFSSICTSLNEVLNFDDLFEYDAVLGTYVYTKDGLIKAIQAEEKGLKESRDKMQTQYDRESSVIEEMKKIGMRQGVGIFDTEYQRYYDLVHDGTIDTTKPFFHVNDFLALGFDPRLIAQVTDNNGYFSAEDFEGILEASKEGVDYLLTNPDKVFQSSDTFMDAIRLAYGGLLDKDQELMYETIVKDFLADDTREHNWTNLIAYAEERLGEDAKQLTNAESTYKAYIANTKNQIYKNIDWSKAALGTDFGGTNKILIDSLRELLVDENGNPLLDPNATWEEILNLYLEQLYAGEENAEELIANAKTRIMGQIKSSESEQISTAISEVLSGAESVISETTLGLLEQNKDLNIQAVDGVLVAGQDFVNSALRLYERYKDTLLTVSTKNDTYASILSKKFNANESFISTLSEASSLSIDSLSKFFSSANLTLSEFYDGLTNSWTHGLENVLETDSFGKTIIKDWNTFIVTLLSNGASDFDVTSYEYQNAYSAYVDGLIALDNQAVEILNKAYNNAFTNLTSQKAINVSGLPNHIIDALAENGAAQISADYSQLKILDTLAYAKNAIKVLGNLSLQDDEGLYDLTGWSREDLAKNWKAAQTSLRQIQNAWMGISDNIFNLTDDTISNLISQGNLRLDELEIYFTKMGDQYILSLENYRTLMEHAMSSDSEAVILTPRQQTEIERIMSKARSAVINAAAELKWDKMFTNDTIDFDQVTFVDTLGTILKTLDMELSNYYSTNGVLDITALKADLANQGEVGQAIIKQINDGIASVRDTILGNISNSLNYATSAASQAQMTQFVEDYNKLFPSKQKTANELFEYSEAVQGFILKSDALREYILAQQEALVKAGMSAEAAKKYVEDYTQQLLTSNMDIEGFVTGTSIKDGSNAAEKLKEQLVQWSKLSSKFYNITNLTITNWMQKLLKGGKDAVDTLIEIKGKENVTSDEIQAVYRAQATRLQSALEQVELGAGEIISGDLIFILKKLESTGYEIKDLDDGTAVIEKVGDMVEAYHQVYLLMKDTAEATKTEINAAYAKMLTARDKGNIDAIETLGNATGLEYEKLGTLLANYGKGFYNDLEYALTNAADLGLRMLGNGKVRIYDFEKFASQMNWTVGGEAYIEAYNAYNDSLIELDRKVGKQVVEEIKSVSEAKTGSRVNLTYLSKALGVTEEAINEYLEGTGASVANGILTISNGAKIPEIIKRLSELAQEHGDLLTDELAELADTVSDFIDNIISIIKNGLAGSLKNSEAAQLKEWAAEVGIKDLDFTQTAEGLKISEQSAMRLYYALKQVDAVKAELVFDELNSSLKDSNSNYKSMSAILNRIKELNDKIANAPVGSKRREEYEAELKIAKEILAVRSTSEDDSFNFMSNKIPGGQNNPINYYNNWAQAIQKLQDAMKATSTDHNGTKHTGLIDYADWYNIVTELNSLAGRMDEGLVIGTDIHGKAIKLDGSMESAAALIEAGANALTADSTGNIKVALGDIGIDFKAGSDALSNGIDSGLHEMAKSQVQMLDGLIALLEVIVQMQGLGEIAGDDMKIGLGDIVVEEGERYLIDANGNRTLVTEGKGFTKEFLDWRDSLLDMITPGSDKYNEDMASYMSQVKINGTSMGDWLTRTSTDAWTEFDAAIMDSLYQAALSDNWDTDNITKGIKDVLAQEGFGGSFTIDIDDDTTLVISGGEITTIDWTNNRTKEILRLLDADEQAARDEATRLVSDYNQGKVFDYTELKYSLALQGKIVLDDNEQPIQVEVGGNVYTGSDVAAAMYATYFDSLGLDYDNLELTGEDEEAVATAKVKIGDKEVTVTSSKEGVKWYSDTLKTSYDSRRDLLDAEYKAWLDKEKTANGFDSMEEDQQKAFLGQRTFEAWQWTNYSIHERINTQLVDDSGNPINLKTNPEMREKVEELCKKEQDELKELITEENITEDGLGHLTIDIGGVKITGNAEDFYIEGTKDLNMSAVEDALQATLGVDLEMKSTITSAMQESAPIVQNAVTQGVVDGAPALAEAVGNAVTAALNNGTGNGGAAAPPNESDTNHFTGVFRSGKELVDRFTNVIDVINARDNEQTNINESKGSFDLLSYMPGIVGFTVILDAANNLTNLLNAAFSTKEKKEETDKTSTSDVEEEPKEEPKEKPKEESEEKPVINTEEKPQEQPEEKPQEQPEEKTENVSTSAIVTNDQTNTGTILPLGAPWTRFHKFKPLRLPSTESSGPINYDADTLNKVIGRFKLSSIGIPEMLTRVLEGSTPEVDAEDYETTMAAYYTLTQEDKDSIGFTKTPEDYNEYGIISRTGLSQAYVQALYKHIADEMMANENHEFDIGTLSPEQLMFLAIAYKHTEPNATRVDNPFYYDKVINKDPEFVQELLGEVQRALPYIYEDMDWGDIPQDLAIIGVNSELGRVNTEGNIVLQDFVRNAERQIEEYGYFKGVDQEYAQQLYDNFVTVYGEGNLPNNITADDIFQNTPQFQQIVKALLKQADSNYQDSPLSAEQWARGVYESYLQGFNTANVSEQRNYDQSILDTDEMSEAIRILQATGYFSERGVSINENDVKELNGRFYEASLQLAQQQQAAEKDSDFYKVESESIFDAFEDIMEIAINPDNYTYDVDIARDYITPEFAELFLQRVRAEMPEFVPTDLTVDDILNGTDRYLEFLNTYEPQYKNHLAYAPREEDQVEEYDSEESKEAHETLQKLVDDINSSNQTLGYYDSSTRITPELAEQLAQSFAYLAENEDYEWFEGITVDDILNLNDNFVEAITTYGQLSDEVSLSMREWAENFIKEFEDGQLEYYEETGQFNFDDIDVDTAGKLAKAYSVIYGENIPEGLSAFDIYEDTEAFRAALYDRYFANGATTRNSSDYLPFMSALDPNRRTARDIVLGYGQQLFESQGDLEAFYSGLNSEKATELSLAFLRFYGAEGVKERGLTYDDIMLGSQTVLDELITFGSPKLRKQRAEAEAAGEEYVIPEESRIMNTNGVSLYNVEPYNPFPTTDDVEPWILAPDETNVPVSEYGAPYWLKDLPAAANLDDFLSSHDMTRSDIIYQINEMAKSLGMDLLDRTAGMENEELIRMKVAELNGVLEEIGAMHTDEFITPESTARDTSRYYEKMFARQMAQGGSLDLSNVDDSIIEELADAYEIGGFYDLPEDMIPSREDILARNEKFKAALLNQVQLYDSTITEDQIIAVEAEVTDLDTSPIDGEEVEVTGTVTEINESGHSYDEITNAYNTAMESVYGPRENWPTPETVAGFGTTSTTEVKSVDELHPIVGQAQALGFDIQPANPMVDQQFAYNAIYNYLMQMIETAIDQNGSFDMGSLNQDQLRFVSDIFNQVGLPGYEGTDLTADIMNGSPEFIKALISYMNITRDEEHQLTENQIIPITGEVEELDTSKVDGDTVEVVAEPASDSESDNGEEYFGSVDTLTNATRGAAEGITGLDGAVLTGAANVNGLAAEAFTAGQHVSKMGELAGGSENGIVSMGDAAGAAAGELSKIKAPNLGSAAGATGNVGRALAGGTLMGELGPELVVSNGQYFVVGQNGPEMVNLADDAIVFNHLQTKSLLEKGMSFGRGQAVTNEQNAVAFAKGNIHGGPAMASAGAALAALKQLRAQWKALETLTAKDLAAKGGGGGGGGGKDDAFIKALERWYDLLQEIAKLEQQITYEQAKRSKIASDYYKDGYEYYNSQKRSLTALQQEIQAQQELVDGQEEYFKQRRAEMNSASNPFTALYTFDENGQLKYKEGAYALLSDLAGGDSLTGKPNHTIEEQYNQLIAWGYGNYMKYDDSGKEIDAKDEAGKKSAIDAFWAKIESDKSEMQELHDSIEEHKKAVLEKQQAQNEILKSIEDNQISLENKVLKAIEDAAKRQIDELEDQKSAIEKSNEELIKGLTDQLDREKELYETQQSEADLEAQRRRLAILQRSGGSASEINALQKEIDTSSRELYFTQQQQQIDAIQEASENQIEKLQKQIDIMNESLEYQKEHGLLWEKVYEVMAQNPTDIANFIKENDSAYWGKSSTDLTRQMRDDLFEAEQWKAFSTLDGVTGIENMVTEIAKKLGVKVKEESNEKEKTTLQSGGSGNGNKNSGGGSVKKNGQYFEVMGKTFNTKEEAEKYLKTNRAIASSKLNDATNQPGAGGGAFYSALANDSAWKNAEVKTIEEQIIKTGYTNITATQHTPVYTYKSGRQTTGTPETHNFNSSHKCTKCGYVKPPINYKVTYTDGEGRTIVKTYKSEDEAKRAIQGRKNGKIIPQYASGGMDYETGLAMLHGTPTKPEAVLNAEQTATLRNEILGSSRNSLLNLLLDFREAYTGLSDSTYNSIDRSSAIVIEHAEVNMNVAKMDNSYDAAKAGDDVMREMLNIARKTSAQNRIGR